MRMYFFEVNMNRIKCLYYYFTVQERILWISSMGLILLSFFLFDSSNPLSLIASLLGVTAIVLNAKGNPLGQFLMIIFSMLYGYISYTFAYYGEMLTYLGMTMPMATVAFFTWLRHPFRC